MKSSRIFVWPIDRTLGICRWPGGEARCALGRGGVKVNKLEGDGATPVGTLPLLRIMYRADRAKAPNSVLPVEPIDPSDGWCDDPQHSDYNQPVALPHPASCETMWRDDSLYDIVAILAWNDTPVVPGRGSAIFLHVARPDFGPTEGCVALAPNHLRHLLSVVSQGAAMSILSEPPNR